MKQEMNNERWSRIIANLMSDIEMYEYDIARRDDELDRLNCQVIELKREIDRLQRGDEDE